MGNFTFKWCVLCLLLLFFFLENIAVEVGDDEEDERPQAEERLQVTGKVGAKKQRKLEEKQARRAQREVGNHEHLSITQCLPSK